MKLIHKSNINVINPIDNKEYKVVLFENNNIQGQILNDINGNFYSFLTNKEHPNSIFLLKFRHIPNNKDIEYVIELGILKHKTIQIFLKYNFYIIENLSVQELINKIIYKI